MPWGQVIRANLALGTLTSFVRKIEPTYLVDNFNFYVDVGHLLGFDCYQAILDISAPFCETLYSSMLYPEKEKDVEKAFIGFFKNGGDAQTKRLFGDTDKALQKSFKRVHSILKKHLKDVLTEVNWAQYDVVGFTTTFYQMCGSLVLARELKAKFPNLKIVVGGATVSGPVGTSILNEYPFIDYIVQGEGEEALVRLLRKLDKTRDSVDESIPGVYERSSNGNNSITRKETLSTGSEIETLDELPYPDFDDYVSRIKKYNQNWTLVLESTRGCWWDRVVKTGDPKQTCTFCTQNIQWKWYREKTPEHVGKEVEWMTTKYSNNNIMFVDTVLRPKGVLELADALERQKNRVTFNNEPRANTPPYHMVRLWEAGLDSVTVGFEAFSTRVLKEVVNKGTTLLQNLQILKTCNELGIDALGNLILSYPSTTQEDVEETIRNIRNYASAYTPINTYPFVLEIGSTVAKLPEEYGVYNIRSEDFFLTGFPKDVYDRLIFHEASFERKGPVADWSPVKKLVDQWWKEYQKRQGPRKRAPHALTYYDSGSFVKVIDTRKENLRTIILKGDSRDIFMYCLQIRKLKDILSRFHHIDESDILELLDKFVDLNIACKEGKRFLTLACASRPTYAAERIRNAYFEDLEEKERNDEARKFVLPSVASV